MNETLDDAGQAPHQGPPPQSPHPTPPHQDLDRLRRSTTDRYIAGVAGGLGRHFNIDPTVLRVLLVVLTFFGGAGLVVYAVCWLFVPEDGAEHALINTGSEPRKILLLAAAGVAFLLAAGDAFHGFHAGWPIVSIAVVVAIVLIARDRRNAQPSSYASPGGPPPYAGTGTTETTPTAAAYPPPPYAAPATTTTTAPTDDTRVLDTPPQPAWQPSAWQPPVARPPLVPPRPKRTGIIWFWPTLALIAVGLGVLGIYDHSHEVVDGAYPALALAITAVMLLVGSVTGRPGGLILVGLASSLALAGNVVVGGAFGTDARAMTATPASAAGVRGDYANSVGEIRLDLSQVSDPAALAGRHINVHLRTGYIEVVVPRGIDVDVDAAMDVAGGIQVPGDDGGGFNHHVRKRLYAVPASTAPPLELDLDAKLGQITVEYR